MMRTALVILAICSLSLSGCGTFSDAMCGPVGPGYDYVYYRGVRFDALAVREGGPMFLMAADMPLSAVADTLLIPFVAYHQLKKPPRPQPNPQPDEQVKSEPFTAKSHHPADPK